MGPLEAVEHIPMIVRNAALYQKRHTLQWGTCIGVLQEHFRIPVTGWDVDYFLYALSVHCTEYPLLDSYPLPFNHQAMGLA
jgi:hypothetical protein